MKETFRIGDTFTYRMRTTEDMSASQYQASSPPVFATPFLVGVVEAAAARLMENWLDPQEMSVGGEVSLRHTAPTPLGWDVRATATLTEAKGRRFTFQVECYDELEKIGEAVHSRFVVERAKFMELVRAKAARRKGGP